MTNGKRRGAVMLVAALLLAGGSVFFAKDFIQIKPVANTAPTEQIETTQVVVATTKLAYGTKLKRQHIKLVNWPIGAVPEGSFTSIDQVIDETGKPPLDRIALRSIEINEPILKSKITGFGGRASLSTLIAPGMRATTIRVNDVSGVAGFVLPGDRVDVLLTRSNNPNAGKRDKSNLQTAVFLQNMKVLAIAQDSNEDRNKPAVVKAVTLEVTPHQTQKLTLAQKLGVLSLALRNVNAVDAEDTSPVNAHDLGIGEANLAPTPIVTPVETVTPVKTVTVAPLTVKDVVRVIETHRSQDVSTIETKRAYTVSITRGTKKPEVVEVIKQKPTFSAPAFSKPLMLAPSILAPAAPLAVMASPTYAINEPLNLLAPPIVACDNEECS